MRCLVSQYWWKPSAEEVEWAKSFIPSLPQEYTTDGYQDKYKVDGWEITTGDDGIYAWDETGGGEIIDPKQLPERVRAAFYLWAHFRSSWWPGGENAQGFAPSKAIWGKLAAK